MTLSKNAQDPNQQPQNAAAIAISIGATTFVVHPLFTIYRYFFELLPQKSKLLLNKSLLNLIIIYNQAHFFCFR